MKSYLKLYDNLKVSTHGVARKKHMLGLRWLTLVVIKEIGFTIVVQLSSIGSVFEGPL